MRSPEQNYLRLYGLIRAQDGLLRLCNEIYRRVFGDKWIKKSSPRPQTRQIRVVAAVITWNPTGVDDHVYKHLISDTPHRDINLHRDARQIRVVAAVVALILISVTILFATRNTDLRGLFQAQVTGDKPAGLAALVPTPSPTLVTFAQANTPIPPSYTSTPVLATSTHTPVPPTRTDTPVTLTHTAIPDTFVTQTATPNFIPIRSVSPLYSAICRNPVAIRWTGQLQLYQVYRVRLRYVSSDSGSTDLPQSERLTEPVWVAQLPERITLGGERHAIAGEIDWQVLVNDTRTGETVNMSAWFKFYFDPLTGQSCP